MPVVLIVGGHGQVAQQITKQLVAAAAAAVKDSPATTTARTTYTVHSLIRNPDQAPAIEKLGAHPVIQDLEAASVPDLLTILSRVRPQVVIWAAGAGYTATAAQIDAIDHKAAIRVMDALAIAANAGECGKRLLSISSLDLRDRQTRPVPDWYTADDETRSEKLWTSIGAFLAAKLKADRALRTGNDRRGLEYTMVRPGGLSNDPGVATVSAGKVHLGTMISREDVASVVVACIDTPDTIGLAFDVVGGSVRIKDAVKSIGEHKIDTFEGYY